jgi:ribosomal protein S6E (S10)
MASNISVFLRFSDGTFGSLRTTVTESSTAFGQYTEITTEGGDLNQTAGVSVGQAFSGQTVSHAFAVCATDSATTAALCSAYFEDTNGSIMVPIQGGGQGNTGFPMLKKPIRLSTGVVVKAALQDAADLVQIATLAVYCASGKSDCFAALGVDDTPTAMVNPQGKTIGQSLDGQTIQCAYATYAATNGLDDNDGGVNALYIENASGVLKAMYPVSRGGGTGNNGVSYVSYPVKIVQNDTLTVTASL